MRGITRASCILMSANGKIAHRVEAADYEGRGDPLRYAVSLSAEPRLFYGDE
jgi:hypothetical protein